MVGVVDSRLDTLVWDLASRHQVVSLGTKTLYPTSAAKLMLTGKDNPAKG